MTAEGTHPQNDSSLMEGTMNTPTRDSGKTTTPAWRTGLGWAAMFGLAALAVPRALFHDLAPLAPFLNALLAIGPVLIWIAVAVMKPLPRPFTTLLIVGCLYGIMLGVVHQATGSAVFGDNPPQLGGNLEGVLSPAIEQTIMRSFMVISSIATGTVVGGIAGAIATGTTRFIRRPN